MAVTLDVLLFRLKQLSVPKDRVSASVRFQIGSRGQFVGSFVL